MKFLLVFPSLLGKFEKLLSDTMVFLISGSVFAPGYLSKFWNSFSQGQINANNQSKNEHCALCN